MNPGFGEIWSPINENLDYVVWQSPDINPPNINPDKCINSPGDESIKSRMEWYVIRYFHWHLPNLFLCVVVVVVVVVVVWLEASRGNSRELWRHQRSIISVVLPLPASSIQPPPAISSSSPPSSSSIHNSTTFVVHSFASITPIDHLMAITV